MGTPSGPEGGPPPPEEEEAAVVVVVPELDGVVVTADPPDE